MGANLVNSTSMTGGRSSSSRDRGRSPARARLSPASSLLWDSLLDVAAAFCPPLEVAVEEPGRLRVFLHNPETGDEIALRYRSQRGLFLRTYLLVVEAEVAGSGPAGPGELVLRHRRLRWRRPQPRDGRLWRERLGSSELLVAMRPLQVERLTARWEPERSLWRLTLETLSGSVTVTFFPPLFTPNPLTREEAGAFLELVGWVRRAVH